MGVITYIEAVRLLHKAHRAFLKADCSFPFNYLPVMVIELAF